MKNVAGQIGLGVAVIIGMNAMIGAGIVAIPAFLSNQVGPAGIFSYAFSIFVVLTMSLSLAKLAEDYPGEGWSYRYPKLWGGHRLGMISALSYLLGVMIAMGFLVQKAGAWAANIIPALDAGVLAVLILILLTALVLAGANASSWGQYIIAAVVVVSLGVTAFVCISNIEIAHLEPFMPGGVSSVFAAAPKAMFTLLGFESIASLYSIVKRPKRNVPLASVLAVLAVGTLYLIFSASIMSAVPRGYFAENMQRSLPSILQELFPSYAFLSWILLVGGLFAIIGTLHSMIWSVAVLLVDVAATMQNSLVRRWVESDLLGPKLATCIASGVILLSALFLRSDLILDASVCLIVLAYILAMSLRFKSARDWRNGKNILTGIAVCGGLTLIYYAITPWLL